MTEQGNIPQNSGEWHPVISENFDTETGLAKDTAWTENKAGDTNKIVGVFGVGNAIRLMDTEKIPMDVAQEEYDAVITGGDREGRHKKLDQAIDTEERVKRELSEMIKKAQQTRES